jgi:hypothetical protein
MRARLRAGADLVRRREDVVGPDGWTTVEAHVRQLRGLHWEVAVDDAVAAVLAACRGSVPLRTAVDLLAGAVGESSDDVAAALLPVVRDLVGRGILLPPDGPGRGPRGAAAPALRGPRAAPAVRRGPATR